MSPDNDYDDGSLDEVAKSLIMPAPGSEEKPATAKPNGTQPPVAKAEPKPPVEEPETEEKPPLEEPAGEEGEEDIDIDEIELDVLVDGENKKAKIKDLKNKYSAEGAIDKRLQEATELRAQLDARGQELYKGYETQKQKLAALDAILEGAQQPDIDWDTLRQKDPGRYLLEREKFREIQDKRRVVAEEDRRITAEQEKLAEQARQEHIRNESLALAKKIPELRDVEKSKVFMSKAADTAKVFGYTPHEVASALDHRVFLVLEAAGKWLDHEASQKKVMDKEVTVKPLLKAGKATKSPASSLKRLQDLARAKAKETGKVEDVAATLLVRGRR